MDRLGIERSLLSVSSPGVRFGDVDLARAVNEAGRKAVVDHPDRFGLLASLPLPDVDAAIAEIAHCCDHLDVDGFVLLTNVDGTYVSDPSFAAGVPRARPTRRSGAAAPDVAGVLGAHVARTAPADDRVPVRHDAHRHRPGAATAPSPPTPICELIVPHAGAVLPLLADRVARVRRAPRAGRRRAAATSAGSTTTSPVTRCRARSTCC